MTLDEILNFEKNAAFAEHTSQNELVTVYFKVSELSGEANQETADSLATTPADSGHSLTHTFTTLKKQADVACRQDRDGCVSVTINDIFMEVQVEPGDDWVPFNKCAMTVSVYRDTETQVATVIAANPARIATIIASIVDILNELKNQ